MPDTTAAAARRATHSLCIVHRAFCVAMFAALAASAATTYTWQNTDGTGILNTPENWSPALGPFVANDVHSIPLPTDGTGATFHLDGALTSSIFRVTGGMAGGAPVVFDLGGHTLLSQKSGNTGYLDLYTGTPLVFRDGAINAQFYLRLGIDGSRDTPFQAAFTNVALPRPPYMTRYAKSLSMSFTDCAVTNFPNNNPASNTRYDFDHCIYSLAASAAHFTPAAGATNVVYRFVNGTTFGRNNTAFNFGSNTIVTNCHYSFETGSDLSYKLGIRGAYNSVGFTNADLYAQFDLGGADSVYSFHDAIVSNYPASGTLINNLQGTGNLLSFTGPRAYARMQYLDFYGTGNRLVFGEGTRLAWCNIRVSSGSGHSIRADPGSVVAAQISLGVPGCTASFTNATLRSGQFASSGTGNRLLFHDSIISNAPASGTLINNLGGSDALLSVTGPNTKMWIQYLDISGQRNRFVVGDNLSLTNRAFALRFGGYTRDCDVDIGTNTQIKLNYITWADSSGKNTNITVRLGKGSKMIQTGRGDVVGARFGGVGFRFVLDDAAFEYRATAAGQTVSAGGTIEFLGDDALMRIYGLNGAIGCIQMGGSDFEGLPPLHLAFRPGGTGFHDSPPINSDSLGYSYIEPTVVFDVDATAFARGKPGGVYDIPLVRKAKSFSRCNVDALNAIGVFEPANGRLVFDKDGNLVFRFKRDVGTRLMLR